MKSLIALSMGLALFAAACGQTTTSTIANTKQGLSARTGRWLVVFKSDTLPADAARRIEAAGGKVFKQLSEIGVVGAVGDAAFAAAMAADNGVASVGRERVHLLPEYTKGEAVAAEDTYGSPTDDDSLYYYQWYVRRIRAPQMWDRVPLEAQSAGVVAVLDTGVADDHPDLDGQLDANYGANYCPDFGGTYKSSGYPSYTSFIDFDNFDPSNLCTSFGGPTLYNSHGTHTTGTIKAAFGGGATVGVAPGLTVRAYKVFDVYKLNNEYYYGAFDGPLLDSMIHAALTGVDVVSLSLGSHLFRFDKDDNASWLAWDRIAKLMNRLGVVVVASAGNAAVDLNGPIAHVPSDLPTVTSTSATAPYALVYDADENHVVPPGYDYLASYSNYGSPVDIAAPGGDYIYASNIPGAQQHWGFILAPGIYEGGPSYPPGTLLYYWFAGTSMATPQVAAAAGVMRALNPGMTPGAVRAQLKTSAQHFLGARQLIGLGILDVDAATK